MLDTIWGIYEDTIGYLIVLRIVAEWKDVIELDPQQSDCHSGKETKLPYACHPTSGYTS